MRWARPSPHTLNTYSYPSLPCFTWLLMQLATVERNMSESHVGMGESSFRFFSFSFKSKDIGFQSENTSSSKKTQYIHDCSLLRETVGTLPLCLNRIKLPLETISKQENKILPKNVQNCPLSPPPHPYSLQDVSFDPGVTRVTCW